MKTDIGRPVLFLSPSSSMGGAERVLLSLLGPWIMGEFQGKPTVVCVEDGPIIGELSRLNIPSIVRDIPPSIRKLGDSPARKEGRIVRTIRMALAVPSLIRLLAGWKKWLRREAPAWIHSNGFKTHILSAWSAPGNTPIFWHLHDFVGERPLMRKLLRSAWRPGIRAIAISKAIANDFSRVLPECPLHVWHNTIDCERFRPGIENGSWLDEASGLPGKFQGLRIGMVATFARWKGQDVFLKACSQLAREFGDGVRFYLVGGPVYQTAGSQWSNAELLGMIKEFGLEGKLGLVPFQKDTSHVYRSLDVVVHASTRPEPFGLVIGEAMACGKPVVAALQGGAAEIGRQGIDCVGHEPGKPESLAAAIGDLVRDDRRRDDLATNARLRILKNFGPENITNHWRELLAEVKNP